MLVILAIRGDRDRWSPRVPWPARLALLGKFQENERFCIKKEKKK